jgi:hypothetical protein
VSPTAEATATEEGPSTPTLTPMPTSSANMTGRNRLLDKLRRV